MPGVYVGDAKIAALGLKVRRGCTYHGLSLNVDVDDAPFADINPCGYAGLATARLCDVRPGTGATLVASKLGRSLAGRLALHDGHG